MRKKKPTLQLRQMSLKQGKIKALGCRIGCRKGVERVSKGCRKTIYIRMILNYLSKSVTYISQCGQNVSKVPNFSTPPTPLRHPFDRGGVARFWVN
jgi:hypothetical protein